MKRIFSTLVISSCLFLCGCEQIASEIHLFEDFYEYYIMNYYDIDYEEDVEVVSTRDSEFIVYDLELPSKLFASRSSEASKYATQEEVQERQERYQRHKEISQRNGEVGFNRWCSSEPMFGPEGEVWNTDNLISKITIVSNGDFDEEHPAGTPLDDVVSISYDTYRPYIENGYVHPDSSRSEYDYNPYKEKVALEDFVAENSKFMSVKNISLSFHHKPTVAKQHTFEVTLYVEGKEPFRFSFSANFFL